MKYRRKPTEVEAVQYNQLDHPFEEYPVWLLKALEDEVIGYDLGRSGSVFIKTLEGKMRVAPGDYIVQGIIGELWAVKPEIFALTYEKV